MRGGNERTLITKGTLRPKEHTNRGSLLHDRPSVCYSNLPSISTSNKELVIPRKPQKINIIKESYKMHINNKNKSQFQLLQPPERTLKKNIHKLRVKPLQNHENYINDEVNDPNLISISSFQQEIQKSRLFIHKYKKLSLLSNSIHLQQINTAINALKLPITRLNTIILSSKGTAFEHGTPNAQQIPQQIIEEAEDPLYLPYNKKIYTEIPPDLQYYYPFKNQNSTNNNTLQTVHHHQPFKSSKKNRRQLILKLDNKLSCNLDKNINNGMIQKSSKRIELNILQKKANSITLIDKQHTIGGNNKNQTNLTYNNLTDFANIHHHKYPNSSLYRRKEQIDIT